LVKWHNQDPPSAKEINRNNAVYGYQNNRNPFIDSPQYVAKIWGGAVALEPSTASSSFVVKSNTLNTALLGWTNGNGQKRLVLARAGAPVNALPADSISYLANNVFGSGQQLGSGNYVVYNGMGSVIEVSGLNPNLVYHFLVIEYNGTGRAINYFTSNTLSSGAVSLPVEWLHISGKQISPQQIQLIWKTASEKNNKDFTIERWNPTNGFEAVGSLAGKGNTNQISNYSFIDESFYTKPSQSNVEIYRLKQTDFDGNYSYSEEISIEKTWDHTSKPQVQNPLSANGLKIFSENIEEVELLLTDINGRIIFQTQTTLTHETFIPFTSELPAGMYVLHIVQRTGKQTYQIIKP